MLTMGEPSAAPRTGTSVEALGDMAWLQRRASVAGASSPEFDEFYRRTWPDVVAYCAGLLGDRDAGEEAAQEAFVRVYPHWPRLDDPRPYVFRVASNVCGKQRRHRSRSVTGVVLPEEAVHDSSYDETRRVVVEAALRRLPLKLRQVLLLHYYADLAVADISEVLRRPAGTVKRQLHEAREALAVVMHDARDGDTDGPS